MPLESLNEKQPFGEFLGLDGLMPVLRLVAQLTPGQRATQTVFSVAPGQSFIERQRKEAAALRDLEVLFLAISLQYIREPGIGKAPEVDNHLG